MTKEKTRSLAEASIIPKHAWVSENLSSDSTLTSDGLENIADYKYKSGQYTHLDELCNPAWTYLTNLLPLWLAPVRQNSILLSFFSLIVFLFDVRTW